jgi:hypothetical protein
MIEEELNSFLLEKKLSNNFNFYFDLNEKVLKEGIKCFQLINFILKDKEKSIYLFQNFIILSSIIRDHEPLKVTDLKDIDIINSYSRICLNKLYELFSFINEALNIKYGLKKFPIILKRYNKKPIKFFLRKTTTIKDIKKYFYKKKKTNIILVYNGSKLSEEVSIEELGIKENEILYMFYNL